MSTHHELPTEYAPVEIADFVGPARRVAERLQNSAAMCLPRGAPASHLLIGPSGSGKSALVQFTLRAFGVPNYHLTKIFGKDASIDSMRAIAADLRTRSILPGYRGIWLEEFGESTKDARDRALEFCGDYQPRETLVIATANLTIEEFEAMEKGDARGRLGSRFQIHVVECPQAADAVPLVKIWLSSPDAISICEHASIGPDGKKGHPINMRSLLKDTLSWMQR